MSKLVKFCCGCGTKLQEAHRRNRPMDITLGSVFCATCKAEAEPVPEHQELSRQAETVFDRQERAETVSESLRRWQ